MRWEGGVCIYMGKGEGGGEAGGGSGGGGAIR